jgi:putative addiction module component (TIGR02574 family)
MMDEKCLSILEAALALPEEQRALLVERLLETLSPEGEDELDDELAAELERRLADYHENGGAIPWEQVKRMTEH